MRPIHLLPMVALAAVVAAFPAAAQAPSPGGAGPLPTERPGAVIAGAWAACNADLRILCADVPPGGGRLVRCLAANRDRLSPQCRWGLERAREALGF